MRFIRPVPAGAVAGALLGLPLAAAAAAAPAHAQAPVGPSAVPFELRDASLTYGQRATAAGAPGKAFAGRRVVLEHRGGAGAAAWTRLAERAVDARGRYRLRGRVPRSGVLRVALVAEAGSATAARSASTERRVRVAAKVGVASRRLHVTAGRRARVSGTVLPAAAGLPVRLEIRRRGGWAAIDSTRTRAGGAYRLADRRSAPGSATVRVRVAAARAGVAPASRSIGRLNVYRHAAASWYGPGLYGNRLGCGGRLGVGTLGVAHKSLPCGTKVTFRKGGRSVRVRVVDRGPYVGGREYDLTAATARRLGFRGHGPVLATR